jgi:peptide/nickel transport system substrate-binding protein
MTLQRHANQESQSGAYGIMQGIESMKVDGDYVAVTLATANADLPYLMSDYHLQMQPGGGMENPADGIGAGCYKVVVDEPGVRHVFEKHANYWDSSRGHYDSVEFVVINDPTARMAALQSGQIHIANRVEPKVAQMLASVPGIQVKNVSGRGHYVFIMHCNTAPFDNKDLRLALKYAIDRQEMVEKILQGYGSVGNDIPINAAYPLFDETLEQRAFDLEKAAFAHRAAHLRGCLPGRGRCGGALPADGGQGRHPARDQARAGRRLLVGCLERAALLRLLLGRASGAGPDVFDRLSVDRGLERHALQQRGVRQPPARGAGRA